MKTLNRTLSLVLVLVMVLGLFGVASAKFNDDAEIQYKEAVGVAVGIGAIDGYADGTFNPKGNITREEAAKLITYAILGADLAKTLTVSNTGFKDVTADRWSAPFVSYLVNKGIINGMGDGTFDPTGKVTGYQLGKMLLTAAGYGKNGEYTGDSWELNTAVDGSRLKIFEGSKAGNFTAPATREEAALYVYNGIKINKVVWNKTTENYDDNASATNTAADVYGFVGKFGDETDGYAYMVTAVARDTVTTSKTYGKLIATATNMKDPVDGAHGTINYVVDSYDVVGNVYNIYYGVKNAANVVYFTNLISYTVAAPTKTADKTAFEKKYTSASVANFTNYTKNGSDAEYALGSTVVVVPAVTGDSDGLPNIVAWKNAASTIETLTVTVNSKSQYTVKLGATVLVDQAATPAVNKVTTEIDWSKYVATAGGVFEVKTFDASYEVAETTKVVGVPTMLSATNAYTVDGAVINKTAATVNATISDTVTPTLQSSTATNPIKYTFHLDSQGNYFAVTGDSTVTESNIIYATYAWATKNEFGVDVYKLQAVNAKGELVTYVLKDVTEFKKVDNLDGDENPADERNMPYVVTVTNDKATLASFGTPDTAAKVSDNVTLKKGAVVIEGTKYISENTLFIFVPADGAPQFTGTKAIVTKTGAAAVYEQVIAKDSVMYYAKTASANKAVSAVIVKGAFNPAVASESTSIVYVPSAASATATVSGAAYYSVYVDGVKTSLLVKSDDALLSDGKIPVGYYTYTTTNGVATLDNFSTTGTTNTIVAAGKTISNYYNGMFSVTDVADMTNVPFTGALIVDLRDTTAPVTTAAELATLVGAAKIDGEAVTISAVYSNAAATKGVPSVVYVLSVG